jgi:hypothetical protein
LEWCFPIVLPSGCWLKWRARVCGTPNAAPAYDVAEKILRSCLSEGLKHWTGLGKLLLFAAAGARTGLLLCPSHQGQRLARNNGALPLFSNMLVNVEKPRESGRVEPHDYLIVNKSHWRGHQASPLKFLDGPLIARYVPLFKSDAMLRKKLFRPVTKHSARLRVYNHCLCHSFLSRFLCSVPVRAMVHSRKLRCAPT